METNGNQLIEKFMTGYKDISFNTPNYHLSWNLLCPVVKQLFELQRFFSKEEFILYSEIRKNYLLVDLDSTYQAIVNYLDYYFKIILKNN